MGIAEVLHSSRSGRFGSLDRRPTVDTLERLVRGDWIGLDWVRLGSLGFVFARESAFSRAPGRKIGSVSHLFFHSGGSGDVEGQEMNFELRITNFEKRQVDDVGIMLRYIIITMVPCGARTSSTLIT
jgi:hypothetical protein